MVRYRPIWFFVSLMTIYFLVRWVYVFGETGLLRYYLTDLLFVPAMCSFGLIVWRWFRNEKHLVLAWWQILIQVIIVSYYFEMYLPETYRVYTGDPLDVLMYICGGIAFYFVQKKL